MTDMTLEQVRNILRHWPTRTIDNMSLHESRELADAIDAHLAKAADYERAVTEQAVLTECVSVTGRDPSDVIRDVIQWHVSNAAQPVEAVPAAWRYVTPVGEWMSRGLDEADFRIASEKGYEIQSRYEPAKPIEGVEDIRNAVEKAVTEHCNGSDLWLSTYLAAQCIATALAHPRPTGEQAEEMAWTKKAAEFIEKKAQSYADEFGRDDMGSISFGAGRGADKMEEYWMSLIDLAEDFLKLGGKCQVPPDGWECSRAVGHDGQCATSPAAEPDGEVGVMPFVSHAKWPIGMYRQPGMSSITTNNHRTQAEANLTCRLLERNGYGGQCEWFPVRTWVTEDKT